MSVLVSVCNHIVGGCVKCFSVMYVFIVFCVFLIVMTALVLFRLSC